MNATDGNWRNSIYIKCTVCKFSKTDCGDYLFAPDEDGTPLLLPVGDVEILAACVIDKSDCLGLMSNARFAELFRRWFQQLAVKPEICPYLQCVTCLREAEKMKLCTVASFDYYINRLQQWGLLVVGKDIVGVDAVYNLLSRLYIVPITDSWLAEVWNLIQYHYSYPGSEGAWRTFETDFGSCSGPGPVIELLDLYAGPIADGLAFVLSMILVWHSFRQMTIRPREDAGSKLCSTS